jgi:adenosylcobinamide-GDP ribazoletransferase
MVAPPPLRGLRAAFVFLTRVPVGGFPYTDDEWRWAAAHFPLVGALLGMVAGVVDYLLLPLGELAAALGAVGASLLLTGALHEDGLADTSDALGGAFDRDKILAILKDSRVGTFGACALFLSIVGRAALLARLGPSAPWAFVLAGAAARAGPVWLIATMPYVSCAQSKSRALMGAGYSQAGVAAAWTVIISLTIGRSMGVSPKRLAAVVAAVAVVTLLTGWRYARRLGGLTGDFLGATEQLSELAAFGVLAWGHA